MALLDDIGTLIQNAGHATLGTNLFLGTMLDAPNLAVAVYEGNGSAPVETMGGGLPVVERPRIQVEVRSEPEDYVGGRAKIDAIWRTLAAVTSQTVNGTLYQAILAQDSPFPIDRDDAQRVTFVANFLVVRDV